MAKFIICIGPPCSGKSTWARNKAKEKGVVRVNRDDLRTMFKGEYKHGIPYIEKLVTNATFDIAGKVLRDGFDVVLDNTNCNLKTVQGLLTNIGRLKGEGVDVEIEFVLFEIPYWKQRWRNWNRWRKTQGPWIPKDVSKRMHQGFQEVKAYLHDYTGGRVSSGN